MSSSRSKFFKNLNDGPKVKAPKASRSQLHNRLFYWLRIVSERLPGTQSRIHSYATNSALSTCTRKAAFLSRLNPLRSIHRKVQMNGNAYQYLRAIIPKMRSRSVG